MNDTNNGRDVLKAAIIGAAVGATVVALSNKDTRKKITDKTGEVLDGAREKVRDMQGKAEEMKTTGKKVLSEQLEKTQKKLQSS